MYKEDTKAQLALKELIEWLEWMRYAGVQRFYLYDCYWPERPEEKLLTMDIIRQYIEKGYVDYTDWSKQGKPWTGSGTQIGAYNNALQRHGRQASVWRSHLDTDEYPFVPGDTEPGFLVRYLQRQPEDVGIIMLQNHVYGGNSTGPANMHKMRAARYLYGTDGPLNNLAKYLLRTARVTNSGKSNSGQLG